MPVFGSQTHLKINNRDIVSTGAWVWWAGNRRRVTWARARAHVRPLPIRGRAGEAGRTSVCTEYALSGVSPLVGIGNCSTSGNPYGSDAACDVMGAVRISRGHLVRELIIRAIGIRNFVH
jgi:hypothetical protein